MSISIIGGACGAALAQAFASKGESVFLGVPEPEKYRQRRAGIGRARPASARPCDAIAASEVVILPCYSAADSIARSSPTAGKIMVDATNPAPGLAGLSVAPRLLGREIPRRPRVRAWSGFNTTGAENMPTAAILAGRRSCRSAVMMHRHEPGSSRWHADRFDAVTAASSERAVSRTFAMTDPTWRSSLGMASLRLAPCSVEPRTLRASPDWKRSAMAGAIITIYGIVLPMAATG